MKWIRNILKGVSLTAAMFVFQACYGPMEDYYDTKVTFHVVAEDTGEPLQDVRIWAQELNYSDSADIGNQRHIAEYTDGNGEPIFHFDFYRIKKESEAYDIGFEEYVYSGHLCFMEWPELIEDLLPEDTVKVSIEELEDGTRTVQTLPLAHP